MKTLLLATACAVALAGCVQAQTAEPESEAYRVVMALEEALYIHECLPTRINYTRVNRLDEDTAGSMHACQQVWLDLPKNVRDLAPRFGHADKQYQDLFIRCLSRFRFEAAEFPTLELKDRVSSAGICRKFAAYHWRQTTPPVR